MIMREALEHFGNPVLTWMAKNTDVKRDENDNLRPIKDKQGRKRIDGIVALIMALGRALVSQESESVYEKRGPLMV